jgi:hypothetical protein
MCRRFQFLPPSLRIAQVVDVAASGISSSHVLTPMMMNRRFVMSVSMVVEVEARVEPQPGEHVQRGIEERRTAPAAA